LFYFLIEIIKEEEEKIISLVAMKNENNPYLPKTFFYLDFFFLSFFFPHTKKKRTTQHTYTIVTYSAEKKWRTKS
jgi:hypothetical protein